MTDDYLAISNTGKNITIGMSHGMKQRILGDYNRIQLRFVRSGNFAVLVPAAGVSGYKIFRRKNVWNMTMASARFPYWPKHGRIVVPASAVEISNMGAIVNLPTHTVNWAEVVTAAPVTKPVMRDAEAVIAGEMFRLKLDERDAERLKSAWNRREGKLHAALQFSSLDMVVAAIIGACGGFMMAVLLAAAGWL